MSIVLYEKKEGVGIVKINRTDAMNALNEEVLNALDKAISKANEDADISVIVITGEGRAFVAGADIAGMADLDRQGGMEFGSLGQKVFRKIERMEKPTIAAVNGFALGGGCELAMACDLRIAGSNAKFGQPEVGLGITPGYSGTQRLPRLVGKAKAIELILTGDIITAGEAAALGLVNKVVPKEDLMDEVLSLASRIMKNAPLAVRYSNKAIKRGLECKDMDEAIALEAKLFADCFDTEDQKEGMQAFLAKRKPSFKGK